ncbi:Six-hairpin glycosidase-like protein [Neurospora crassa]|nr:Six-hairpin glycosidase-like protein [Neurospora crassa]
MLRPTSWLGLGVYLAFLTQARTILGRQTETGPENDTPTQLITGSDGVVRLDSTSGSPAIVTLDYNRSVEGIPTFEVLAADGDTSVFEITYGESYGALSNYMSDGPLPLAAAMDTYRVNRYSIAEPGTKSNRLVQGAFRFQRLNLSSPGVLTLRNVGVRPTTDNTAVTQLPGSFHSDNLKLNAIWETGARTVQMTEIKKDSTPDFWEVTSEGASVGSLAPQVLGSAAAAQLLYYNVEFKVKPVIGGFGFTVLSDTLNSGIYISCDVANGLISAHKGSTTFDEKLAESALPSNLTGGLGAWHTVHAIVAVTDITVSIDRIPAIKLSQTARFFGSFGLGASFGHQAIFRDLFVSTPTGDKFYTNSLTDKSFLPDFFMGTNPVAVVVDGSRRDRIAYAGDLDIAARSALTSTHNLESILGSLDLLGSYQATPGFFIPNAKIQQEPLANGLDVNITGLIGYSFNLVTAVAAVFMHTGDVGFATTWAPKVQKLLEWADSQTLNNGLFNISDASFGGDWNYYDPTQSGVVTKFNVLYAYALQETVQLLAAGGIEPTVYQKRLEKIREAIDTALWSDELKAYYVSEAIQTGFAQDSNALAILAGVNKNPTHSTETILSTLSKDLMSPVGPHAFSSSVIKAGFQPYISPYASSYHLRAALASNAREAALELLNNLWAPMADPAHENYTGTFWETLDAEGRPGFGLTTSLCHGWATGPTAELTQYVLGVRPTQPGWKEFAVAPLTLGLQSANGTMPTLLGTFRVAWNFSCSGLLSMDIDAPIGSSGTVSLPTPLRTPVERSTFMNNGQAVNGKTFTVMGGTRFVLKQNRKL